MKSLICRLAQRRINPDRPRSGWIAGHLESCQCCRGYLEKVEKMEKQLTSPPSEHDEAMCADIMSLVKNEDILVSSPDPLESGVSNRGVKFGLAAALAFGVTAFLMWEPGGDEAPGSVPPIVEVEEPVKPVEESPAQALATLLQQQEFLRRDARKLGMHLQERVILFRAVE